MTRLMMRRVIPKRNKAKALQEAKTAPLHWRVLNAPYCGPDPEHPPNEEVVMQHDPETGRKITVTYVYWPPYYGEGSVTEEMERAIAANARPDDNYGEAWDNTELGRKARRNMVPDEHYREDEIVDEAEQNAAGDEGDDDNGVHAVACT
jgi:hypothetical protein